MALGRATFVVGVITAAIAVVAAIGAGPWVVVPPLVAAVTVLAATAVAVDYFGVRRRRDGWCGFDDDPRRASHRARVLAQRFAQLRRKGSPWTASVGRSLLLALAECGRLRDAGPVVDFLSADALFTRVGGDPTADALRAMALAELGRVGAARRVVEALSVRRDPDRPIVAYVAAFVDDVDGRARDALDRIAALLEHHRLERSVRRDVLLLKVRVLVRMNRLEAATDTLRQLCALGWRRRVEQLGELARDDGNAATTIAVAHALAAASPYR